MEFPKLNPIKKATETIATLMGIDARPVVSEGWFYNLQNVTNDAYPILSMGDGIRYEDICDTGSITSIVPCVADGLYIVAKDGMTGKIVIKKKNDSGNYVNIADTDQIKAGAFTDVKAIGNKIVILPDAIVYDIDEDEFYPIADSFDPECDCDREVFNNLRITGGFNVPQKIKKGSTVTQRVRLPIYDTTSEEFRCAQKIYDEGLDCTTLEPSYFTSYTHGGKKICAKLSYLKECNFYAVEMHPTTPEDPCHFIVDITYKLENEIPKHSSLNIVLEFKCDANNITDESQYIGIYMLDSKGKHIVNAYEDSTAPASPADGQYWIDTSCDPAVMKIWSTNTSQWTQVLSANYECVYYNNTIPDNFRQYDTVTFHTDDEDLSGDWVINEISEDRTSFKFSAVLPKVSYEFYDGMKITRDFPGLDGMCLCNNRLWGYNNEANEIYASKLGDPYNWYSYEDLSTDSYALEVASPGDFTSCVALYDYIIFFKENFIHRINGSKPQNYALRTFEEAGVAEGSKSSPAVLGGAVYYCGRNGVYAFDGVNIPTKISDPLNGNIPDGYGCRFREKYVVFDDIDSLIYDAAHGTWTKMRPGAIPIGIPVNVGTDTIFIGKKLIGSTWKYILCYMDGSECDDAEAIGPYSILIETNDIGLGLMEHKWVSKLVMRFAYSFEDDDANAQISISVSYDGGAYKTIKTIVNTAGHDGSLKLVTLPIIPHRCDRMRFKIEGRLLGSFEFYGYYKEIEGGSTIKNG